ncbi:phage holin [Tsukamurella tyrosinosolvens]|uniref:phage holin n=1 Tax=Tsukamurella tyrosinosolvens TaxID=57704 RepID=UPI000DF69996|nr:hypothetical protein [Tsukamurella tyrosinosolvens]RDB46206.1 hypothetical protein DVB87_19755 [Tsukamurella tyrosinosolvens]
MNRLRRVANALGLRTWGDVRAYGYVALPVITATLVSYGALDQESAALWAGLGTAILGPVIAWAMAPTADKARSGIHALVGAGQALAIGYGLLGPDSPWVAAISALLGLLGAGLAAANTTTSTRPTAGTVAREVDSIFDQMQNTMPIPLPVNQGINAAQAEVRRRLGWPT